MANLGVVNGKEAVGFVLYLLESLAHTTDLKQIPAIDKEIALCRICNRKHLQNRVFAVAENGTWAPTAGKQMREMLAFNNNVITDTTLTIKSALNESQKDSVDKFVNEILNK